jgi:L-malate glycosyltransferase
MRAAGKRSSAARDAIVPFSSAPMQQGTYLIVLPWELEAVGGVNQAVLELYRCFDAANGLKPRILVPDGHAAEPVDSVGPKGHRGTRMKARAPFYDRPLAHELVGFAAVFPAEWSRIRTLVNRHGVRVVNFHYIGSYALTWLLAKMTGAFSGKIILSLHGLDIRTISMLRGLRRLIWRNALEAADSVVACSQGLAEETIESMQLSGRNVVVIHNGVQGERLHALANTEGLPAREGAAPHLVNLGTFEHKKGHDILLRAFARVVERFATARLTIMGRRADTYESTRALLAELRLEDRVDLRLDAPHEVALALLRNADLFVLPSRNEAFSIALLEAGAMGKPVVAANVCGVPELIDEHKSGVLVPRDDVDALAAGILHVLEDPVAAQAYGQALQRRVLEQFSSEATFSKYLCLVGNAAAAEHELHRVRS